MKEILNKKKEESYGQGENEASGQAGKERL